MKLVLQHIVIVPVERPVVVLDIKARCIEPNVPQNLLCKETIQEI